MLLHEPGGMISHDLPGSPMLSTGSEGSGKRSVGLRWTGVMLALGCLLRLLRILTAFVILDSSFLTLLKRITCLLRCASLKILYQMHHCLKLISFQNLHMLLYCFMLLNLFHLF